MNSGCAADPAATTGRQTDGSLHGCPQPRRSGDPRRRRQGSRRRPREAGRARRALPALLGRRRRGQDLLPRRRARTPRPPTRCTARRTGSSPTRCFWSPRASDRLNEPMLVEREGLLGELVAGIDDALTGQGGLVFVGGEAGVGKSALVRALVEAVGRALHRSRRRRRQRHDRGRPRPVSGCGARDRPAARRRPRPGRALPRHPRSARREAEPARCSRICTGRTRRPSTRCASSAGGSTVSPS